MLAATFSRTGPARDVLTIRRMAPLEPGAGEVRVRIAASGVNPSDVRRRGAAPGTPAEHPLVIPHSAGAGTIDAAGPGVDGSRIGERVWLYNAQFGRPFGTAAAYCTLPSVNAVPLPQNVSFEEGACLGIPGLTAAHAVLLGGELAGATVLIHGGAGAVGLYAIQFAKAAGARVIASVSSAEKAAHARSAGAGYVVDYRTADLVAEVRRITGGRGVSLLLEVNLAANVARYPRILADGATAVVYGFGEECASVPIGLLAGNVTLTFVGMYRIAERERAAAIALIERHLRDGSLRHTIARCLPLEAIVEAHESVERGGGIGATILTLES